MQTDSSNDSVVARRWPFGGSVSGRSRLPWACLVLAGALASSCDDGKLSAIAEKGLTLVPFELDTSRLTTAQKERIGVGSYIVNAVTDCSGCHDTFLPDGPPKYLGGGYAIRISAAGDVVYARNLTPDPDTGMKLTEEQFVEVMRTGKDFKSEGAAEQLIAMPWLAFRWMTVEDLKSMYAYLERVPPVRNPVPNDLKGAAAAARPMPFPGSYNEGEVVRPLPSESASEKLNVERGLAIQPLADPPALASLSANDRSLYGRGSYLVNAGANCNGCHTNPERNYAPGPGFGNVSTQQYMTGGGVWTVPPGLDSQSKYARTMTANLIGATRGAFRGMSFDDFRKLVSTGEVPQGATTRKLAYPMPPTAEALTRLTDDDLQAVYTYFANLAPREGAADKDTQPPARWCAQSTDCNTAAGETCNTATKECVGASCTKASDCGACQTCTAGHCAAPEPTSACLVSGI